MATAAWAVPARRGGIIKTQPDGSEVTIYQHGDEHFHWMTNENGEWLKVDIDGFYRVTEALSAEEMYWLNGITGMSTSTSWIHLSNISIHLSAYASASR